MLYFFSFLVGVGWAHYKYFGLSLPGQSAKALPLH